MNRSEYDMQNTGTQTSHKSLMMCTQQLHQNHAATLNFLSDRLLFDQISRFLTIKEILNLGCLSKQMQAVVEHICRQKIKEQKLNFINKKSSIHQMQFYFNRCLKITKQDRLSDKDKDRLQSKQKQQLPCLTISHPFKFQVIKFFEVGRTYTVYLTSEGKAKVFKTKSLVKIYERSLQDQQYENQYASFSNVRDIHCKSDTLIMTKNNGQVSLISTKNDQIVQNEQFLQWTCKIPILKVQSSFNYCIFFPETQTSKQVFLREIFEMNSEQTKSNSNKHGQNSSLANIKSENSNFTHLIVRNMLNGKYILVNLPFEYIEQCAVGHKNAYFINDNHKVFYLQFDPNFDKHFHEVEARQFEPLGGKSIVKIVSGFNFYLALERNVQNLGQWNNDRVIQWLRQIGFNDFIKIAKVEKLDGNKLKNIQRKYMHSVLGITKQNMQQKFLMSIEENLARKHKEEKLYGWGKNEYGQLGSSSANYIIKPQRIRINVLNENEYIDSIFCGWNQTFVRTQKGRVYCTVQTYEKRKRKMTGREEFDQEKQLEKYEIEKVLINHESSGEDDNNFRLEKVKKKNTNKLPKKKKKGIQFHNQKQKGNKKFEEQQNWFQLSLGKAFFVQTYKDTLFVIQCPNQNRLQPEKVKKLRTARAILDKILWSDLHKDQFKVGYMDKQMGLIEASAYEMEMFDVKENRIKYFKKNGTVIWDREQKIDIL